MSSEYLSKEHQIIATMRKVLSSIIRDTTPPPGRPHPLRERTIEDVKHCFTLITAREQEIHEEAGKSMDMRPRYADEPKKSQVVDFIKPNKDS
ncbi:MAG: segregation and condensation protein A [Gammaproteobacteria bacterium]|jgi:hypothetical protein